MLGRKLQKYQTRGAIDIIPSLIILFPHTNNPEKMNIHHDEFSIHNGFPMIDTKVLPQGAYGCCEVVANMQGSPTLNSVAPIYTLFATLATVFYNASNAVVY